MPSVVQQEIVDQLRKGAALRVRFNKRGSMGDFLLVRRGQTTRVVPRRTIAAICRVPQTAKPPAVRNEPVIIEASVLAKKPESMQAESPILDDLARSLARGKAFSKLSPYEQEHLRSIAARLV